MNPSSPKIDFFGTFLDTLSSSAMGPTAPSQLPQPATSSSRSSQTADPAVGSLSDSIILTLLKRADAGNASVPLATVMIELKQPLSTILREVALLQKFGIVAESADGSLSLTSDGRSIAQTYHDFRQDPKPA